MEAMNRRALLGMAALVPLVAVVGCATGPGASTVEEGVRRLLTLSTERAFDRLMEPNGFYDSQVARIAVPQALAGNGGVLASLLNSSLVRNQMGIVLNQVAQDAARRATPVVLDHVRRMSLRDAVAVLRGGPTAATTLLQQDAGGAVLDVMLPEVSRGLRSDVIRTLSAAIAEKTGVDYAELGQTVAGQASDGIFRAIGREEAAIRADPRATRDPVLIALLGAGRG
ncbi:DUF4197 domain-containing protein [Sphingomonas prati]|uniref:DUF4197 domain-containing protein n=1 Tax=Sphingomonas prati TaxID=1843237 RepID=A0A7W9BV31_9SPHN|nr:DUF4197 domain-containing protein [Sphingomonas prati]MBB5730662.1 hypothetical protein [Sphingomonas prati]GGE96164.1 hypothetical protein GCM10011404_31640 [Sphingomonas prati]